MVLPAGREKNQHEYPERRPFTPSQLWLSFGNDPSERLPDLGPDVFRTFTGFCTDGVISVRLRAAPTRAPAGGMMPAEG